MLLETSHVDRMILLNLKTKQINFYMKVNNILYNSVLRSITKFSLTITLKLIKYQMVTVKLITFFQQSITILTSTTHNITITLNFIYLKKTVNFTV